MMRELEKILSIVDKPTRIAELVKYAKYLGVDNSLLNDGEEYNEEKLSILIYDGEIKKAKKKKRNLKYSTVCLILCLIVVFFLTKLPQYISHFFVKSSQDELESQTKKQEFMHGVYKDYDEYGRVKKVYYYKDGELKKADKVETKKLDVNGNPFNIK